MDLGNNRDALSALEIALQEIGREDKSIDGRAIASDGTSSVMEVILSNIAKVKAKMGI